MEVGVVLHLVRCDIVCSLWKHRAVIKLTHVK
ncbi:hypothetical protein [Staphylococcus phage vB_SauM-V1SA19]|nr:hypothetical protein [Staphylococcus phage vB_SauM-V1SA19]